MQAALKCGLVWWVLVLAAGCRDGIKQSEAIGARSATAAAPTIGALSAAAPKGPPSAALQAERPTTLLYVRIPRAITPLERAEKYETPLDTLLREQGLGEVSGGGTALKAGGEIEYVGIDLEVYDAKVALPVVIRKLRELGVPKGTVVEETRDDDTAVSHPVR